MQENEVNEENKIKKSKKCSLSELDNLEQEADFHKYKDKAKQDSSYDYQIDDYSSHHSDDGLIGSEKAVQINCGNKNAELMQNTVDQIEKLANEVKNKSAKRQTSEDDVDMVSF